MGQQDHRAWVLAALESHQGPLRRYALRLLGDAPSADDAVQHTFLKLCDQSADQLDGRLAPWLYAVCRHRALDIRRENGRMKTLTDHEQNGQAASSPDPAQAAEDHDTGERLRRLIDELPEPQRDAVLLWCEGLRYRQIAQSLDLTEGNVRVLVHRAFQKLREHPAIRELIQEPKD